MTSLFKQPLTVLLLLIGILAVGLRGEGPPPQASAIPEVASPAPLSIPAASGFPRSARSETLAITGAVVNPRVLTIADLEQFPARQLAEVEMICESGVNLGKRQNLRGVLLRDILAEAQLKAPTPKHFRQLAIIARATDRYIAVFSWAELFNSDTGNQVIVYFRKDGLPLGDEEGRIALISSSDTRAGPRHVRWLNQIEVRSLGDWH